MIYSLIPAKVNSQRLPGKNTFKFMLSGKPLIAYTIEAVKQSGFIPSVYTNEPNIQHDYGSIIVERPEHLCDSKTTMKQTVRSFIHKMALKPSDMILLTYLTCPFRTYKHIQEAIVYLYKSGANSLQSLSPVNYRPYGLMNKRQVNNHTIFRCLQDQRDYYQKQNTPTLYRANGAIYLFRISELDSFNNQMFNKNTIGYELDNVEGLDIDTRLDWLLADQIMARKEELCSINEYSINQMSDSREYETEHHPDRARSNIQYTQDEWTQCYRFRY